MKKLDKEFIKKYMKFLTLEERAEIRRKNENKSSSTNKSIDISI